MNYSELMTEIVSGNFQGKGFKGWNRQYYGFAIYINSVKIDITNVIEELKQKGIEHPLNYILEQTDVITSKALEFEDTLFESFEDEEHRNIKVCEFVRSLLIEKKDEVFEESFEEIRVVGDFREEKKELMKLLKDYSYSKHNIRLMKNVEKYFLAIDSNGTIVGGSEYAIPISRTQAEKLETLDGENAEKYISVLREF